MFSALHVSLPAARAAFTAMRALARRQGSAR